MKELQFDAVIPLLCSEYLEELQNPAELTHQPCG
jgi:hypothetical protein